MRILVVEDDQLLNKTLSYNLSAVGYSVDGAMSKAVAIRFLEKQDYDLIVLDVNLPDGNGFDICPYIIGISFTKSADKKFSNCPDPAGIA